MEIKISKEITKQLAEKAAEANIALESAIILVLNEFATGYGSRIYAGTWRRGNRGEKRGMRYVIDWPFQPGFAKMPGNQSIDLGKR